MIMKLFVSLDYYIKYFIWPNQIKKNVLLNKYL